MTPRNFAARVDANQAEIITALRTAGYLVLDISRAGFGAPDLFVLSKSHDARWIGIEIKAEHGKLTKLEKELFDAVVPGPLYMVVSFENALEILEFYDRKDDKSCAVV